MIVVNWKDQVKDMKDEELKRDRSDWMKHYGIRHSDYSDINPLEEDIQTITLEIEQLRRFGEIIYNEPNSRDKLKRRITES